MQGFSDAFSSSLIPGVQIPNADLPQIIWGTSTCLQPVLARPIGGNGMENVLWFFFFKLRLTLTWWDGLEFWSLNFHNFWTERRMGSSLMFSERELSLLFKKESKFSVPSPGLPIESGARRGHSF